MWRSHLVLAVVLVAVVVLCVSVWVLCVPLWVGEGPLWRLVMLKRVDLEPVSGAPPTRGWKTVKRWTDPPVPHGKIVHYYVQTGMKFFEGESLPGSIASYLTLWNLDGTVKLQLNSLTEKKTTPPWWWGVKDQTKPSAPWWNEKQ